jgi:hypothetical protein
MTQEEMDAIVMSFPGAEKGISYGRPSYKVNGKFFTRLRREDESMVLLEVSFDEREMLIEAEPETFFVTDHYKGYPYVLIRLSRADVRTVERFLERRWRATAPKTLLKTYDAERTPGG